MDQTEIAGTEVTEKKARHRRTLEERVADEQAKLAKLQERVASRAAKEEARAAAKLNGSGARNRATHLFFSETQWANLTAHGNPRDVIMEWVKRKFGE